MAPIALQVLPAAVSGSRVCYACHQRYDQVHGFYASLCPDCAELNLHKRVQSADLTGYRALVTGGRVKIGFQTALKLLRAGADVVVTTRFPHDAAIRFGHESDFLAWRERLTIHGLDLRAIGTIEQFVDQFEAPDLVINNAAQTVRRPDEYYRPLLEREAESSRLLPPALRSVIRGPASTDALLLPSGLPEPLPAPCEPTDERARHSWSFLLGEVPAIEMVEALVVNAMAPFMLVNRLVPRMVEAAPRNRFIVNVSAQEGTFNTHSGKPARHPHTNMAKAALNMLTKTSAPKLASQRVFMNSVDPGWISNEQPQPIAERMREELGFSPPLDAVDAAARILDPIFSGLTIEKPIHGCLLKDYRVAAW